MCREKLADLNASFIVSGSPLRVQGKAVIMFAGMAIVRITPACAGKRAAVCDTTTIGKDHPCVCREKSPPSFCELKHLWITPACAGKSWVGLVPVPWSKDHPCVCREKLCQCNLFPEIPGSPLRVQGKDRECFAIIDDDRITPACAGKSRSHQFE